MNYEQVQHILHFSADGSASTITMLYSAQKSKPVVTGQAFVFCYLINI